MKETTQIWLPAGLKAALQEVAGRRGEKLSGYIRRIVEREVYKDQAIAAGEWTALSGEGKEYRIVETANPYRVFVVSEEGPVAEAISESVVMAGKGLAQQMAEALNAVRTLYPLKVAAKELVEALPDEVKRGEIGDLCTVILRLGEG